MRWSGRAVNHKHFFEPYGNSWPLDHTEHNECCRYDAIIDQDGKFLVLRVWNWTIVSEHTSFEEACKHAKQLATY